jgi:L,D-peptidoglycan transpeptidase YkuD (ErfK/YbiS/YcfS/YnhG family)
MKRRVAIAGLFGSVLTMNAAEMPPPLPKAFAAILPKNSSQVLFTVAEAQDATLAKLWLLEKNGREGWKASGEPIRVRIGRKGMAWGRGEHSARHPEDWRRKVEGDSCTPAGVFSLGTAFGRGARPDWMKMPYLRCTKDLIAVDDPKSRHYNQFIDLRNAPPKDWSSAEQMLLSNGCYDYGLIIHHNADGKPGAGSCIFMHIWQGPEIGTSGCTAMAKVDLIRVLKWLDPAKAPRLVQTVTK